MHPRNILRLWAAVAFFAVLSSIPATAQQYQIVRAGYGAGLQRIDVTQRLRELVCSRQRFGMATAPLAPIPRPV